METGVLVIGSINHDSIYQVAALPRPHETIPASAFTTAPGGKGANQAAACAMATDRPVRMLGAVGADLHADVCLQYLETSGVDITQVLRANDHPTGTACILVEESGHNLIVVSAGANGALMPAHITGAEDLIAQSHILLLQLETPMESVRAALTASRELGKTSILNPAPYVSGVEELIPLVDMLTPNETEASALTGIKVTDADSAGLAAKAFLKMGAAEVVITLGQHGYYIATQTTAQHCPAYHVCDVVDTSGAGDVFNGALAGALADGAGLLEAAQFASASAALSVQKPTASHCAPSKQQALEFMNSQ